MLSGIASLVKSLNLKIRFSMRSFGSMRMTIAFAEKGCDEIEEVQKVQISNRFALLYQSDCESDCDSK